MHLSVDVLGISGSCEGMVCEGLGRPARQLLLRKPKVASPQSLLPPNPLHGSTSTPAGSGAAPLVSHVGNEAVNPRQSSVAFGSMPLRGNAISSLGPSFEAGTLSFGSKSTSTPFMFKAS